MKTPSSIRDIMAKKLITFKPDTNVLSAIHTLLTNNISGAPVVDDEKNLVGILSEKDCMRTIMESSYYNEGGKLVSELMSTNVETVDVNASIYDVAEKFLASRYRRFPVVNSDEQLVGQVSRRDVLRAIDKQQHS